jgi:hypothetical protein
MTSNDHSWARGSTLFHPNYALTYSHSCSSVRSSGTCDISKAASDRLRKQSAVTRGRLTTLSQCQTTSTFAPNVDPTRTSETGDMHSCEDLRSMYRRGEANGLQIRRTRICVPIATTIAGDLDRSRNRRTCRAYALDERTSRHAWSVGNGTRKLALCSSRRTSSRSTIASRWIISSPQFPCIGRR